jgi:hypothetical protein
MHSAVQPLNAGEDKFVRMQYFIGKQKHMSDTDKAVLRLVREAKKKFGKRVLAADDPDFTAFVYAGRARFLKKPASPVTAQMRDFVKERLSRCGLEKVTADAPSVWEFWDIFDDYEFQVMMGRLPE